MFDTPLLVKDWEVEMSWHLSFRLNRLSSSLLNLDPTMQYNTPLMLWFRYWVRFIRARYKGMLWSPSKSFTPVGAVSSRNVTETVTTIVVTLVADFTRAWFVDSIEFLWLHFALMNLNAMAKLIKTLRQNIQMNKK